MDVGLLQTVPLRQFVRHRHCVLGALHFGALFHGAHDADGNFVTASTQTCGPHGAGAAAGGGGGWLLLTYFMHSLIHFVWFSDSQWPSGPTASSHASKASRSAREHTEECEKPLTSFTAFSMSGAAETAVAHRSENPSWAAPHALQALTAFVPNGE